MASDEFDWIALIAPLAGPEGLGLKDDAAVLTPPPGHDLVLTKDSLVEGVHFLPDTSFDKVAAKLLRTNLSDLAAKGAKPHGYLLSIAWPHETTWAAKEAFARGLFETQTRFGLKLLGGDTVSTPGPLVVTATLIGLVETGGMIRRDGAKPGDLLMVSGTIGDGHLGLTSDDPWLKDRYETPQPRLDLNLEGVHACADVSDGLIADAGHIASASGVRMEIDLEAIPLSAPARAWLTIQPDRTVALVQLATGGDDYELVAAAPHLLDGFTLVGHVTAGEGTVALYGGKPVPMAQTGWRHGKDG